MARLLGATLFATSIAVWLAAGPRTEGVAPSAQDQVPPPPDQKALDGLIIDMDAFGELAEVEAIDDVEDLQVLSELAIYDVLTPGELAQFDEPANAALFDEIAEMNAEPDCDTDTPDGRRKAMRERLRAERKAARERFRAERAALRAAFRAKREECAKSNALLGSEWLAAATNPVDSCLDNYRAAELRYRDAVASIRDAHRERYRAIRASDPVCDSDCPDTLERKANRRAALRAARKACRAASREAYRAFRHAMEEARATCRESFPGSTQCRRAVRASFRAHRAAAREARRLCRRAARTAHRLTGANP